MHPAGANDGPAFNCVRERPRGRSETARRVGGGTEADAGEGGMGSGAAVCDHHGWACRRPQRRLLPAKRRAGNRRGSMWPRRRLARAGSSLATTVRERGGRCGEKRTVTSDGIRATRRPAGATTVTSAWWKRGERAGTTLLRPRAASGFHVAPERWRKEAGGGVSTWASR